MDDSDSEYEEEETLVLVELKGVIDSEIFKQDSFKKFNILDISGESPIIQVENFVFTGEYEQTMGTAVFFEEEDKRQKRSDPVFCKKPTPLLKYAYKTNKKLDMKRVFVSEKASAELDSGVEEPQQDLGEKISTELNVVNEDELTSVDIEMPIHNAENVTANK